MRQYTAIRGYQNTLYDIYDYPDPFDSDESIDFEINDDTVAEVVEDAEKSNEETAENLADKTEDDADENED